MASSTVHPITANSANVIIGARCTPAAQWINSLAFGSSSAFSANSTPLANTSGGFGSKSSSIRFQQTSILCGFASAVSSNSICMSMMCVIPSCDTFTMFSADQIPPPTAIRSVTHVIISIPNLRSAPCRKFPPVFRGYPPNRKPFSRSLFFRDPTRGETDNALVSVELQLPRFILRYPLSPYPLARHLFFVFHQHRPGVFGALLLRTFLRGNRSRNLSRTLPIANQPGQNRILITDHRLQRQSHPGQQRMSQRSFDRPHRHLLRRRIDPRCLKQILRRRKLPTLRHFDHPDRDGLR